MCCHHHPTRLYLVLAEAADRQAMTAGFDCFELGAGRYLVFSAMNRSAVYHAVRDLAEPAALLVAPLAGHPKFRGMPAGALKWLKQRSND